MSTQPLPLTKEKCDSIGIVLLKACLERLLKQIERERPLTFIMLAESLEMTLVDLKRTVRVLEASGSTSTPAPAKDT